MRVVPQDDAIVTIVDDGGDAGSAAKAHAKPWQILIVDDESEVHHATAFALSGLMVSGRGLEFLHAYSGKESREILRSNDNIAVILLDVVMESEDAGLLLVHYIRNDLGMRDTRIVLRTGQPGYAPEMQVIQEYDINDYKTKAELTRTRLATTMTTAIRSFEQIRTIEASRRGLNRIVSAAPDLFARRGVESFCEGVLTQIAGLLGLEPEGLVCARTGNAFGAAQGDAMHVVGAAGRYRSLINHPLDELADERIVLAIRRTIAARQNLYEDDFTTLYLRDGSGQDIAVFLDTHQPITQGDTQLVEVFCTSIGIGFENVTLIERLHAYAYVDPLCDLPNRTKFISLLDEQVVRQREGWLAGIIDIDHFSETNDALGHESGDALLKSVGARLVATLNDPRVTVARVAGDTFGVFGPGEKVDPVLIQKAFVEPFDVDGYSMVVSASIGLVRLGETVGNGLDALKNANIGLNRAKNRSRGGYYFYSPAMEAETRSRVKLAHDLRRSIDGQELMLYYQPQIDLASGRPVGAEALLRWKNSEGKFIPPDKFIPVAEYSGLIRPIGEWVMRTACRQLRTWSQMGLTEFRVAVNVSMDQFRIPGFTELVGSIIEEHGVDPRMLELEITESMAMDEVETVIATLDRLGKIGVPVAIDDFGTGYSSLGYLQQLNVDRLKIDRRFVDELTTSAGRSSIPEMIIKLGHSLNLQVIAEGVETDDQAKALVKLGCDEAQGYLYCRPIDIKAFNAWLESRGLLKARSAA